MSKLIIAGDIHGYYSAWQQITHLLSKNDTLAITGDFFDTKYGQDNSCNEFQKLLPVDPSFSSLYSLYCCRRK